MEIRQSTPLPLTRPSRPATTNPLRRRLRARISSWRLDHVLADGTDPQTDPLLACRADQLTSLDSRDRLAEALRDSVRRGNLGELAGRVGAARVRERPRQQRANPPTWGASGLVAPRCGGGRARARLLLVDSNSALYGSASELKLQSALEEALIGLGG